MIAISGVPTSRAATLVIGDDAVWRDQFYNGNFKKERAAVVLRLAQSWFRFGSLEILTFSNEINLLRQLVDFIINHHFSDIDVTDSSRYLQLYSTVVDKTAYLMAKWQSLGFTHGVCNTDNFSILSITIDYGPFGFMDEYNPRFVPNTSDDESRYSYEKQPDVAGFNLNKLRIALLPLLDKHQENTIQLILNGYQDLYKQHFMALFRQKLGLQGSQLVDEEIVAYLLHMMEETKADFTMTFRNLADWPSHNIASNVVDSNLWALKKVAQSSHFDHWRNLMLSRIGADAQSDDVRRQHMKAVNPRYILRNWIAESAIRETEAGNTEYLKLVQSILKNPFVKHSEAERLGFARPPPDWASSIRVSCSS